MTTSARLVLSDARGALSELADGISGGEWRRRWVAAVVLLRAVGHVLEKVDGASSPAMGRAVGKAWDRLRDSKPHTAIFRGFIDAERNNVLKEYQLAQHRTSPSSSEAYPHGPSSAVKEHQLRHRRNHLRRRCTPTL